MVVKIYIKNNKNFLNNKGVALVEMLPILVIFVALVSITLGLWGSSYSAVLQNIAARHYAFEVLNNRSNFVYHRDHDNEYRPAGSGYGNPKDEGLDTSSYHGEIGRRLFTIISEQANSSDDQSYATKRDISFFSNIGSSGAGLIKGFAKDAGWHNNESNVWTAGAYKFQTGAQAVNPIWIMTGYGICLNCSCGDGESCPTP